MPLFKDMEQDFGLKNRTIACLLLAFGFIYAVGIGSVALFDLDELYFAEISREMMVTGNYGQVTFHFEPLYEKPPLFFWIQAASMHLWGINEIGARFPNLLCGLLTLLTLYYIGKNQKGTKFGLLWMSLHATAFLPHFYFKSGIIDPFLNYFLLLAIYFLTVNKPSWYCTVLAGFFLGAALLIKGPIGFLIPIAAFALAYSWFRCSPLPWRQLMVALLIATTLLSCWLIPEIWHNGFIFIKKFWDYHWCLCNKPVATHHQAWYYHYLVLLFGCFPSSLFAIAFFRQKRWVQDNYFAATMQAVGIVVLFIFTLVGTKIVHYSSMAYFPITFFAADFLCQLMDKKLSIPRWVIVGFLSLSMVIGIGLALIPWVMLHKALFIPFIKDQEIITALNAAVVWNYWDSVPGIIYILGSWIAFRYLLRAHFMPFIWITMCMNILALTLFLIRIAPKIECYTQKELVDFCKAYKGKDVYMVSIGFKAAAPHFYTHKSRERGLKEHDLPWLLAGPIDKPCFFIVYKSDASLLAPYKDIYCIQANPGCFAFYKRLLVRHEA